MKILFVATGVLVAVLGLVLLLVAGHDSANAAPGDTTADRVYGQSASFTSNTCNSGGLSASSLCTPDGVFIDGAGRMYIADSANNRVLMYPNTSNNVAATKVFGQNNLFNVNACNNGGINPNTLCSPAEVTGDALGNIYIADTVNNRVLEYDDPNGSCGTCDTVADRVFGQLGSFITGTINKGGISADSLKYPTGLATDTAGNLYVADRLNARVLEFDNPVGSCGSCDATADKVFGQGGSFTTGIINNGGISANSLNYTLGLGMDSANNLYVADFDNNRVLEYNAPLGSCGTCDTTADLVFGQLNLFTTNFVNNNAGVSATALFNPTDVTVDSAGNVFISETGNERTLEYNQPFSTDTVADQVFGQGGSFTSFGNNSIGLNADSQADPWSLAFDNSCNLYVADYGNNRTLEYDGPPPNCTIPPTPTVTSTPTATSTVCPAAVCTPTPTATITATPTATPTCNPNVAPGCSTPTDTPTDTATPTATPTCDPAIAGNHCSSPTPTATPTCDPGVVQCSSSTPTATPTCDPSVVQCSSSTPTRTPTCVSADQCSSSTPTFIATTTATPTKTTAATVTATRTPNLTVDTDGDGCADPRELGFSHTTGGQRDPNNPWDFFDVPLPVTADPALNGSKNRFASIGDVMAVVFYIGTFNGDAGSPPNRNGVRYDSLKDGDWFNATTGFMGPDGTVGPDDKVGRQYDRSPSTTPGQPWRSGPPNGAVSIQDAIVALNQVGDDCN